MAAFSLQHLDQHFFPCFSAFVDQKADFSNNDIFVSHKCGDDGSSSGLENHYKIGFGEEITQTKVENFEKKRVKESSLLRPSNSMGENEMKTKRQRRSSCVRNEEKEKKLKKVKSKKDEKKISEAAPIEYVHVRAKRGQATDSHSLAERVRREKISERMRILQELVPGCDKITGKALMLDEIINYVQSLQNQVEFLSSKLASLNPICLEFPTTNDKFVVSPQAERYHNEPHPLFPDTFTGLATPADIYPLLDHATSTLLFSPQMQSHDIPTQDNIGQALWDVMLDEQRQKQNNEFGLIANNLCSFQ